MKKQFRILSILTVAVLISIVCDQQKSLAGPNTFDADGNFCLIGGNTHQAIGTPMELWLGVGNKSAGTLVGQVTFDDKNVIINLTDSDNDGTPDMFPYFLTGVHIHFAEDVESIPHTNNGNPIPGQFEYNVVLDDPSQSVIEIPVEFDAVGAIHLSAVQYGGLEALEYYLPSGPVQMKVKYPQAGDPSYLEMTLDDAGRMDGVYESWCGDVDRAIDQNIWYTSQLYSWHDEDLPTGLFENPENLEKVNYLLNTFYVGKMVGPLSSSCTPRQSCGGDKPPESLTYGDIQVAIWTLIEDTLPDDLAFAALGNWSQDRVNAILCDVNDNGDEFIPTCDDETPLLTEFIVVPDDGTQAQISLIELPCESTEGTAWGDGKYGERFPGAKRWGAYFNYDANCVPGP